MDTTNQLSCMIDPNYIHKKHSYRDDELGKMWEKVEAELSDDSDVGELSDDSDVGELDRDINEMSKTEWESCIREVGWHYCHECDDPNTIVVFNKKYYCIGCRTYLGNWNLCDEYVDYLEDNDDDDEDISTVPSIKCLFCNRNEWTLDMEYYYYLCPCGAKGISEIMNNNGRECGDIKLVIGEHNFYALVRYLEDNDVWYEGYLQVHMLKDRFWLTHGLGPHRAEIICPCKRKGSMVLWEGDKPLYCDICEAEMEIKQPEE